MILMYLRKSRQDDPSETIEQVLLKHETILQEFAIKEYGYKIDESNIYREVVSGETIDDRPQIKKMFERMQSDDVEGVLVVESSRLTRGDLLDCGTVVHLFRYTNTQIITPQKIYNLDDKFDRKFFEMELTKGNDYLEYTKEILKRGRENSKKQGNYISSVPPYGYKIIKNDKSYILAINEDEARFVRLMFEWRSQGLGPEMIANKLNDLGAKPRKAQRFISATIKQMIENPVYIGYLRNNYKPVLRIYEGNKLVKKRSRNYQCELIKGKHEAIITEELFNKCQIKGSRENRKSELKNPFAGLMKCQKCGRAIGIAPHRGIYRYYCTSKKYCDCASFNAQKINEAIVGALKNHLDNFEVEIKNDDTIAKLTTLKKSLDDSLYKLEQKQERLYTFLEDGTYTKEEFMQRMAKLKSEKENIIKSLESIQIPKPTSERIGTLHEAIDLLLDDDVSAKNKNTFLKSFIEVIYFYKEKHNPNFSIEIVLRS